MTERQKTLVWKRTNAHRDRFGRSQTREWYKTLMAQIQPVIKEVSPENLEGLESRIPMLMPEDPILDQLTESTITVGVYFAKETFKATNKAFEGNLALKLGGMPTDDQFIGHIRYLLGKQGGKRITSITGESRDQAIGIVRETLQQGAKEGLGTSQVSVLLRDNLNEQWGKISTYRAARIARTEVTFASNMGSLVGAKETEEPMMKVWLSTRDSRTRRRRGKQRFDHYGKAPSGPDGEKRELDEKFTKTGESLEYPGDYSGSAGNVIHCRCTMFYEPKTIDEVPEGGEVEAPPKPPVRTPPKPPPPKPTNVWADKETATKHMKEVLGADDLDLSGINLEYAKAYTDQVIKMKAEGWPVQIGRFGPGKRMGGAVAWAWQKLGTRQSMIEYSSWFKMPKDKFISRSKVQISKGFWTKVDAGNELKAVLTHETAHAMVTFDVATYAGTVTQEVKTKAITIFKRYNKKVRDTWKAVEKQVADKMVLLDHEKYTSMEWIEQASKYRAEIKNKMYGDWYISQYASKNLEEFWAESFEMVQLNSRPSPFAQEVVDLIKGSFL